MTEASAKRAVPHTHLLRFPIAFTLALCAVAAAATAAPQPRITKPHSRPPANLAVADPARPPGHETPPPDRLREVDPVIGTDLTADAARRRLESLQDCGPGAAEVRSGPALVAFLAASHWSCIESLFSGPEDLRRAAFTESNVLYVLETAGDLAMLYDGTNDDKLAELLHFVRAAWFNEWMGVATFSIRVNYATMEVLDEFIQNPRFWDVTEEHGIALEEVFVLMDSLGHGHRVRYAPIVRDWLAGFGARHIAHPELLAAANRLMYWFFRGHWDDDFLDFALDDAGMIEVLRHLALSDSLLEHANVIDSELEHIQHLELLIANAAGELTRFLEYEGRGVDEIVTASVREILARHEPFGRGASIWIVVAGELFDQGRCSDFDICHRKDEIERTVLAIEHSCSERAHIRAQSMTPEQLHAACDEIRDVETFFFDTIGTGVHPVPGDRNATLEVVIYGDYWNYQTYSYFLFGNDTDNGGIYLEGDPADPRNVPRAFCYMADWLPEVAVWNLQHEYVHYLDGRFNLHGDYWDSQVETHKTIWWAEGLAEYVSFFAGVSPHLAHYLESDVVPLHEIFAIFDYADPHLYPKAHLATWFMFERRPDDVSRFLEFFRVGDYDGYLEYLNEAIGEFYENAWRRWLAERVTS